MSKLQIERKVVGMVSTNCYLLIHKETKECIIVDPADSPDIFEMLIMKLQVKPVAILLTHGHFDHCGAAEALAEKYKIPIGAGIEEEEVLMDSRINLSAQFGHGFAVKPTELYRDKQELTLAGFQIQVFHTPGHTKGGVCYYLPEEKVLISGDTIFCESVGRSDFPTGSTSTLVRSVRELLANIPEETTVYPGHDQETTIAHEKEYNPYK